MTRRLYWISCQKCDAVVAHVDLGEMVRQWIEHLNHHHPSSMPHYAPASSVEIDR